MTRELFRQELSGQQAWRYADRIAQYNRIQGSTGYREAAEQVAALLKRDGVDAKIVSYPAKTGERFLAYKSFQEWQCRGGQLWLLEDNGRRRLARYGEKEVSLVQRSAPTPPEGVEAELINVPDAENPDSYKNLDLKGKIALVRGPEMTIHALAVEQHGAIGLVFDNLNEYPPLRSREDMPDAVQYTSYWWFGSETKVFGFCVSSRVGDELRQKLKKGPVKLFAEVDAKLTDGSFENVEYFIPGKQEQEILLVAHLCHPYPGAQDNASGPSVLMEVMRSMRALMEQGKLPSPQLGIRFLLVPEMTGTYAYFAANPERKDLTVAALNLDMVGADQAKGGGPLCIEQPPLATPTFTDRFAFSILDSISKDIKNFSKTFSYSTCHYLQTRFSGGSDHYVISDPTIGIPCPMIIQWPDMHYHTSMDHPNNLDPKMLERVAAVTSLYAWGLANGSQEEWLEFLLTDAAKRRDYLRSIMEWALDNSRLKSKWRQVLDFYRDYELKAWDNLASYGEVRGFSKLISEVKWAKEHLTADCETLLLWAEKRAGTAAGEESACRGLDPEALARVYSRTWAGPSHLMAELARLPVERRLEWNRYEKEAKISLDYDTFLEYWLDGERPLEEVLKLVKLETGAWHPEYALKYVELCEELGIIHKVS